VADVLSFGRRQPDEFRCRYSNCAKLGVGARYYGDWGTQLQDRVADNEKTIWARWLAPRVL
jgi:hypothetical protein